MKKVIDGLRKNQVICPQNIENIKSYINKKYPGCDSRRSAIILADAVYKIIDRNIKPFDEKERKIIKKRALRRASKKDDFSLDSYDIFIEYLSMNENNCPTDSILSWLNANQSETVTKEDMLTFSKDLEEYNNASLEIAIERVIENEEPINYDNKIDRIPTNAEKTLKSIRGKSKKALKDLLDKFKTLLLSWLKEMSLQFTVSIEYITHNPKIAAFSAGLILIILLVGGIYGIIERELNMPSRKVGHALKDEVYFKSIKKATKWEDGLSWELRYTEVDVVALKKWLKNKNSLLAEEPYFSAIINAGKRNNINPLLLFAITGQEQSFVPRNQKNALRIANNPFNVYRSWIQYNTNINDSAEIAAKTIIKLSKNRPTAVDEIEWINRKYAQDKRWWKGVRRIFTKMQNEVYNK